MIHVVSWVVFHGPEVGQAKQAHKQEFCLHWNRTIWAKNFTYLGKEEMCSKT